MGFHGTFLDVAIHWYDVGINILRQLRLLFFILFFFLKSHISKGNIRKFPIALTQIYDGVVRSD